VQPVSSFEEENKAMLMAKKAQEQKASEDPEKAKSKRVIEEILNKNDLNSLYSLEFKELYL
jgi:hypothetical protein